MKIRYTPTDDKQKAQMKEWMPERENVEFQTPVIPYQPGNSMVQNSHDKSSSNSVQPLLPTLDLPNSEKFSGNREKSQLAEPLCTDGTTLENPSNAPLQHKSTRNNFGQEPQ